MRKDNEKRVGAGADMREKPLLHDFAIFTLSEAKTRLGLEPELFLHLASHGIVRVFAEVPSGMRVFSVDPGSTELGDSSLAALNVLERRAPEQKARPEPARWAVRALVVSPGDCAFLRDFISKEAQFFRQAVEISDDYGVGGTPTPQFIRPVRLPLFEADGATACDQSKYYFGVYPRDEQFPFIEGVGYRTPADVHLDAGTIRIFAADINRVLLAAASFIPADIKDDGDQTSRDDKKETKKKRMSLDAGIGFLRLEDVLAELGVSESTLYNFYDKNHPSYDPTFPRQVQITNRRVGWLASELAQWIKERPRVSGR